ncbi:hypothetical protein [Paractinoplanes atraurantiacus]|uniref:Uncharacterized protein n=1 Tax=Paractinoplanes atraurantiacus TaxID=1036182 RepID=A0A285K9M9_9ACTN|nr:hypothetical protein [Actinoplanes atraurantiacus]SNY68677.1 hypothetical protein SAMN05421748_133110 [Actinoplanes atraurantiacus]
MIDRTFTHAEDAMAVGWPDVAETLFGRIRDTVEDLEEPHRMARRTMALTGLLQLLTCAGRRPGTRTPEWS